MQCFGNIGNSATEAAEVPYSRACKNEEAIKAFLVSCEACKNCFTIAIQSNIHFFFFFLAKPNLNVIYCSTSWPGIDVNLFFLLLFLI